MREGLVEMRHEGSGLPGQILGMTEHCNHINLTPERVTLSRGPPLQDRGITDETSQAHYGTSSCAQISGLGGAPSPMSDVAFRPSLRHLRAGWSCHRAALCTSEVWAIAAYV